LIVVGERSGLIKPTKLQGIGSFGAKLPHMTVNREFMGAPLDTGSAFFVKLSRNCWVDRVSDRYSL